jgi:hypothetical protein
LWQPRKNETGIVIQWSICQILGDFGPSGGGISISCFKFDALATEMVAAATKDQLSGQKKA